MTDRERCRQVNCAGRLRTYQFQKNNEGVIMAKVSREARILIPDYDPDSMESYPGDIKPGYYSKSEVKKLLKKHKGNPEVLQFIRDMMEV